LITGNGVYESTEECLNSSYKPVYSDCTTDGFKRYKVTNYVAPINGGYDSSYNGTLITQNDVIYKSTTDTCPVDCSFTQTYSGFTSDGYKKYTVSNFKGALNGGAPCKYNGTTITGNGEYKSTDTYPIDCKSTVAYYDCGTDGYKRYNVTGYAAPIHGGLDCSYNGTAITGNGWFKTSETCPVNCSYNKTEHDCVSPGYKRYNVTDFTPALNNGSGCSYNGTAITGNGVFQSNDRCSKNCTYNENQYGCNSNLKQYITSNYSAAINEGTCGYGINGNNVVYNKGEGCNVQYFTNVGTTTWTAPYSGYIQVAVVGGGGGGAAYGGDGGNAGEYKYDGRYQVNAGQSYTVTVGGGGAALPKLTPVALGFKNCPGGNGGNSQFGNIVATGGGGGQMDWTGWRLAGNAGSGAGGPGIQQSDTRWVGGRGGPGIQCPIDGKFYGSGGGGGGGMCGSTPSNCNFGDADTEKGGGGRGGNIGTGKGWNGKDNTGGGGGAGSNENHVNGSGDMIPWGSNYGGNGGSGVVIIAY
jgi:hypothetical protein